MKIRVAIAYKIADFGLSTYLNEADDPKNTVCGTNDYMAPEVKQRKGHKEKVDCWNMGCILYALLVGRPPQHRNVYYPEYISHEAKELLKKLLAKDPVKRICIEAVPNFEFFKKYGRISKSKSYLCRSDDSGNGSRNHFSSPIEKESCFRSLDSGFNSKNSSSKKSKSSRNKYYSEEKLAERRNFDLPKDQLLPTRKHYLSNDRKRSVSEDRKPYKPLSCNNPQQVYNSRERSASAQRGRIGDLKSPYCHDYANDACRIISRYV
ncbi:Serine/threonine-protein kinase PLK4 [Araneus ventricosus]|uniref:Serine/threonine-protein kinase PLK4 n=1 Tax=Araneus ventricosus TaxID=182803 RepID=A0A4Y2IBL2_ARAVE|nr:Serine/threonine-protein kinase PLK4 [Araneus ventricosus]